ncbi:hypothetical protein UB37_15805 [Photobacterium iliopiscarium]|uniref:hypothetical protein n=1 Tax=Photobacterium iliopiscarium TaxID=56192 RepID=UPI0005D36DA6|nr:hypothetical protein [Photobacterium iliopiscarium]KJG19992.1 hypothetical protein UB37_15805 [Photobacterium iliopiscarium]
MIKRIFVNISWLSIEKILSIIIILAVEGILARNLDSMNYGIYQYSLNIALLITIFVGIIPGEVVVPIITKYKYQKIKIIKTIILSRFIISFVSLFFYIFFYCYY